MGIDRANFLLPGLVAQGSQARLGGARSPNKGDTEFQKTTEAVKLPVNFDVAGVGLGAAKEPGFRGLYNQIKSNGNQHNLQIDGKTKQAIYAYMTQKNQPNQEAQDQVSRMLGVDYYA